MSSSLRASCPLFGQAADDKLALYTNEGQTYTATVTALSIERPAEFVLTAVDRVLTGC